MSPTPLFAALLFSLAVTAAGIAAAVDAAKPAAQLKVLKAHFQIAEQTFDPALSTDQYSSNVIEEVFDAPLTYDFLAIPPKLKPALTTGLPEASADGKVYTLRFKRGILFQDDPAFNGKPRELNAADCAFGLMRTLDPTIPSRNDWVFGGKIKGSDAAIKKARETKTFDYTLIEGLKLIDSHTLEITLEDTDFNFPYFLAFPQASCVAREVVDLYGNKNIGEHPVGTGPFQLESWRRASKIVLKRNPTYREEYYNAEPAADDKEAQQLLKENKGKKLPIVDKVEIYVVEESQPQWLGFLNGEFDWLVVPPEFRIQAYPGEKISPNLAKRGMKAFVKIDSEITYAYFNMTDKQVGGYTPDKVALRRAMVLAYDLERELALIRNNGAIRSQSVIPFGVRGYSKNYRSGNQYSPAKAKALLDIFGYKDREGDGCRENPDGSKFDLTIATEPDQLSRQYQQLRDKNYKDVGLCVKWRVAKWPDNNKASKLNELQVWNVAWRADYPDGENFLQLAYGPNSEAGNNNARFKFAPYDALYKQAARMPPGPERDLLYEKMVRIIEAYVPINPQASRIRLRLAQPWVSGWRKHPILHEGWRYADVDMALRTKAGK